MRVQQAMEVDDEVAHLRVINRLLRTRFPSCMSRGVVRVNAYDVKLRQVLKGHVFDARQLAPKNKVQELLFAALGHVTPIHPAVQNTFNLQPHLVCCRILKL